MQTKSFNVRTSNSRETEQLGQEIEAWSADGWTLVSHTTTGVPYRWSGKGLKAQDHVLVFQRGGCRPNKRQSRKVAVTFGQG